MQTAETCQHCFMLQCVEGAQCRRATHSCGNCIPTISFLCYVNAVPVAVTLNEALAKRSRVLRVLKRRNSAPNSWLLNRPVAR